MIELPISDDLDVSGWDLRKALRLLAKSNPTLLEWLRSSLVYRQEDTIADELRRLAERHYSPIAAWHHDLSMARGNYRGYLQSEQIRTKKYPYVLRPVLACHWIARIGTPPPMAFEELLQRLPPDGTIRAAIDDLLVLKRAARKCRQVPEFR